MEQGLELLAHLEMLAGVVKHQEELDEVVPTPIDTRPQPATPSLPAGLTFPARCRRTPIRRPGLDTPSSHPNPAPGPRSAPPCSDPQHATTSVPAQSFLLRRGLIIFSGSANLRKIIIFSVFHVCMLYTTFLLLLN